MSCASRECRAHKFPIPFISKACLRFTGRPGNLLLVSGAPKISCFPVFVRVFLREEMAFLITADVTDALRRRGLFNNGNIFPPPSWNAGTNDDWISFGDSKVKRTLNPHNSGLSESNFLAVLLRMALLRVSSCQQQSSLKALT